MATFPGVTISKMNFSGVRRQSGLFSLKGGCNGSNQWSPRTSFLMVDWQVRVFDSSGILDRPSECVSVKNIPMSGCMDI